MERILVIDDDKGILDVIAAALTELQYEVKTTTEPKNLFAELESFNPEVLLLDFMLANTNGGAICHQLKCSAKFSRLPVVMMSGFNDVHEFAEKSGCNDFIRKPFDLFELDRKIKSCIGAGRTPAGTVGSTV